MGDIEPFSNEFQQEKTEYKLRVFYDDVSEIIARILLASFLMLTIAFSIHLFFSLTWIVYIKLPVSIICGLLMSATISLTFAIQTTNLLPDRKSIVD